MRLTYAGAMASAALYAYWLETRPRKYHPDVTVVNVTGGVALTGAWVATEIATGLPDGLTPRQAASWSLGVMCRMFVTTATPIWAMELYQQRRRVARLLGYLWRPDDGPDPTPAIGVRRRKGLWDRP